ncbi:hypothetical protein Gocc_0835 [Gaiella occulta]|uniref:Uncharacterized protein n=1 Tax=Gaiella occulta TaxID=1002870 RepID=A0A7M2YY05_9ACTN|nr:hypothetical protein [Gaiella occulta]RDI75037.1 hypothetical protein Gocc_0835 [Gaiella occulta]
MARRHIRRERRELRIPKHPYRDTAILNATMAVVLVLVAALTGGDLVRALTVAVAFLVVATAWSWWRLRERIREQDRRAADRSGTPGTGGDGEESGRG